MNETISLIETLKRILKSRDITYAQIAKELGISEASVKRVFSDKRFSLERFEKICQIAGLSIAQVAELSKSDANVTSHTYTTEQERFFADNTRYLAFFDLLIRFGSLKAVLAYKPDMTDAAVRRYLKQLESMGLVERHPGDKVRFPVSRNVRWQKKGPLRRKFLKLAKEDFILNDFSDDYACFEFSGVELTEKSARKFAGQFAELAVEIRHIADMEAKVNARTRNFGFLAAIRPWRLKILENC